MTSMRIGLVVPKNTAEEKRWLLGYLRGVTGEAYSRGGKYDLVWFLNVTRDIIDIKRDTGAKLFVVGMEPKFMHPLNYDADLLDAADR